MERAARALIAAEPYRESGYVLLMESLAAEGNAAQGLREFDRLRALLRDELGTTPSPEAIEIHERLLRPQRSAAVHAPEEVDAATPLPAELRARASGGLIGRRRELELLEDRWAAATTSEPAGGAVSGERLVLLTGEAGVGKTRLASEFARRVHDDGATVLAGRCPQDPLTAYQPFVEAMRLYVMSASLPVLRAATGEYGAELGRLLPELRQRAPELVADTPIEADLERYRLFEAVVGMLRHAARSAPLLLVLDDLQWADRPTMLLLRHLVRASDTGPLLVLGAIRSGTAPGVAFDDLLGELRRDRLAGTIDLAGMTVAETAELVRARAGGPAPAQLCTALHARTEGNPFFVEELVRHLAESGVEIEHAAPSVLTSIGLPEGVRTVISGRLARLSDPALALLRAAAVIGRDFDVTVLERVVELPEEEFLTALDEALASGLVVQRGGRPEELSFSHAVISETVYDGLSLPRRTRVHRRVGETLERRPGVPQATALALHFARAASEQDADRAIDYSRAAGQEATAVLAHEDAAEHFSRALEVQQRFRPEDLALRGELLLGLGEARVRSGDRAMAWGTFREAATIALERGDNANLARAALGASRRYIQPPGLVDEGLIEMISQALAATEGQETVTRVALLARLCGALYYAGGREHMQSLAMEATRIAAVVGTAEAGALAAAARCRAFWDPEHIRRRVSDATELLTLGGQAGDLELTLQGHAWLVLNLLEDGDIAAVDAQIEAFIEGAERLRQPFYLWNAGVYRAMRAMLSGALSDAERLAADALALGAATETVTAPQYYAIQLLAIRREQSRMTELEPPLRQLVQGNPHRPGWLAGMLALLVDTGREREARELLEGLDLEAIPHDGDWLTAVTLLTDVCADLGDCDRAEALYTLLAPHRDVNVVIGLSTVCLGSAARYLGRLSATIGDREQAAEHYEAALERDEAMEAPIWLAHTQLEYARLLGPEDARGRRLAEAAAATARDLSLAKVARRARELGW